MKNLNFKEILIILLLFSIPFVSKIYRLVGVVKLFEIIAGFIVFLEVIEILLRGKVPKKFFSFAIPVIILFFVSFLYSNITIKNFSFIKSYDILYTPPIYNFLSFCQITIYILSSLTMYLWIVNKKVNLIKLLKYLFWFLVLYQTVVIVFFLFPITKPLMGSRHLNGTFPEKGSYSAFIVMYSLLLLFANEYYKIFSKRKAFLLFGLLIISLVFSYGARGFVFLLVYLFFKFILVSRNLKEKLAIILVTISFLYIGLFGYLISKFIALRIILQNPQIAIGRYAGLILFPKLIGDYPIFGIGLGNYIFARVSREYGYQFPYIAHDYMNNVYLEILLDLGIIGTALFLFFFSSGILLPSLKGLKFKQIKKFLPFLFAFLAYCSVDIITFYQVWNLLFLSLAILALYKEEILHRDKSRQLTYAAI